MNSKDRVDSEEGASRELYDQLVDKITPTRGALASHWVYQLILDRDSLRKFMETHIFAVWDFMTLLKRLQQQLTCITTPWFRPESTDHARLINEIVLGEESDEVRPGIYMSHVSLYLAAMEEVGADSGPFDRFIASIQSGTTVEEALKAKDIPKGVADFVCNTMDMSLKKKHEVASAFLFGREAIIPEMFRGILGQAEIGDNSRAKPRREQVKTRLISALNRFTNDSFVQRDKGLGTDIFRLYLERHIELDEGSHGPMSERLLISLCGDSETNWREATESAQRALLARHKLWEGLAHEMMDKESD